MIFKSFLCPHQLCLRGIYGSNLGVRKFLKQNFRLRADTTAYFENFSAGVEINIAEHLFSQEFRLKIKSVLFFFIKAVKVLHILEKFFWKGFAPERFCLTF